MVGAVTLATIVGLTVNGCVSEKPEKAMSLDKVPAFLKTTPPAIIS